MNTEVVVLTNYYKNRRIYRKGEKLKVTEYELISHPETFSVLSTESKQDRTIAPEVKAPETPSRKAQNEITPESIAPDEKEQDEQPTDSLSTKSDYAEYAEVRMLLKSKVLSHTDTWEEAVVEEAKELYAIELPKHPLSNKKKDVQEYNDKLADTYIKIKQFLDDLE